MNRMRSLAQLLLSSHAMIEGVFQTSNYQAAVQLMDVVELKHQALASNLANVQTPGYKRMDVDPSFEANFQRALSQGDVQGISNMNVQLMQDSSAISTREDGNNVQMDKELMEMNQNAVEYRFLTEYLSGNIKHLKMAITGRSQ